MNLIFGGSHKVTNPKSKDIEEAFEKLKTDKIEFIVLERTKYIFIQIAKTDNVYTVEEFVGKNEKANLEKSILTLDEGLMYFNHYLLNKNKNISKVYDLQELSKEFKIPFSGTVSLIGFIGVLVVATQITNQNVITPYIDIYSKSSLEKSTLLLIFYSLASLVFIEDIKNWNSLRIDIKSYVFAYFFLFLYVLGYFIYSLFF